MYAANNPVNNSDPMGKKKKNIVRQAIDYLVDKGKQLLGIHEDNFIKDLLNDVNASVENSISNASNNDDDGGGDGYDNGYSSVYGNGDSGGGYSVAAEPPVPHMTKKETAAKQDKLRRAANAQDVGDPTAEQMTSQDKFNALARLHNEENGGTDLAEFGFELTKPPKFNFGPLDDILNLDPSCEGKPDRKGDGNKNKSQNINGECELGCAYDPTNCFGCVVGCTISAGTRLAKTNKAGSHCTAMCQMQQSCGGTTVEGAGRTGGIIYEIKSFEVFDKWLAPDVWKRNMTENKAGEECGMSGAECFECCKIRGYPAY